MDNRHRGGHGHGGGGAAAQEGREGQGRRDQDDGDRGQDGDDEGLGARLGRSLTGARGESMLKDPGFVLQSAASGANAPRSLQGKPPIGGGRRHVHEKRANAYAKTLVAAGRPRPGRRVPDRRLRFGPRVRSGIASTAGRGWA